MNRVSDHVIRIDSSVDVKYYDYPNGSCVIVMPDRANWIKTSSSGRWVFESLLHSPRTLGALVADAAERYRLPEVAVRSSIRTLVDELHANGLAAFGDQAFLKTTGPVNLNDHSLRELWLNITGRCNLRCDHCFAQTERSYAPDMATALACAIIDQAADIGVGHLVLSGGEPTLHEDLAAIVQHARRKDNLKIKLVTNGTRSDASWWDQILPHLDDLQISVDGASERTNDAIRGKGVFAAVRALFKHVHEGYPQLVRGISFTPLRANLADMRYLDRLAHHLDASYIHLNRPKIAARGLTAIARLRGLTDEDRLYLDALAGFDQLADQIAMDAEKSIGVDRKSEPVLDRSFDPGLQILNPFKVSRCAAGTLNICVDNDGSCFPCAALIDPAFSFGRVDREPLVAICQRMRLEMEQSFDVETDEECCACDFRHFCGGGCRATAGNLAARDPACEHLKARFERILGRINIPKKTVQRSVDIAGPDVGWDRCACVLRRRCD